MLSYVDHNCSITHPMFITPSSPGNGAATPGDTAGQGAAPPGDQVTLADSRGWPLPSLPRAEHAARRGTRARGSEILRAAYRYGSPVPITGTGGERGSQYLTAARACAAPWACSDVRQRVTVAHTLTQAFGQALAGRRRRCQLTRGAKARRSPARAQRPEPGRRAVDLWTCPAY